MMPREAWEAIRDQLVEMDLKLSIVVSSSNTLQRKLWNGRQILTEEASMHLISSIADRPRPSSIICGTLND